MLAHLTKNVTSADNQQERLEVSDDYLIGFVEGEGCFYTSIVPSKETKSGWQVIHFFKVSQNPRGENILVTLQRRLQCGYIKRNARIGTSDATLAFVVRKITDLQQKVIPFFEGKLVIKNDDFTAFCEIVKLVADRQHFTRSGIIRIAKLSAQMNTRKRRYDIQTIIASY